MAFVNNYKVMDVFNAIDLHTGEMIIPARIYVDSSFKGAGPDFGQSMQRVINTDKVSFAYHVPDPRMEWPSCPGFGLHDNADAFGYIICGEYDLMFPDGSSKHLVPDSFFQIKQGQPYRFVGVSDTVPQAYAVFYGKKIQDVTKIPYDAQPAQAGCEVKYVPDVAPLAGLPKGVEKKLLAEGDGLVIYDVTVQSGVSYPAAGFLSADCYHLAVILSGEGMGVYPDKDYRLAEETAVYHEPAQPYKIINTGDAPLHMIAVYHAKDAASIALKELQITDVI